MGAPTHFIYGENKIEVLCAKSNLIQIHELGLLFTFPMVMTAMQTENISLIRCWTCVKTKTLCRNISQIKTLLSLASQCRKQCFL